MPAWCGPYREKLCQRSQVWLSARGFGTCSRPLVQLFLIRTSSAANNVYICVLFAVVVTFA